MKYLFILLTTSMFLFLGIALYTPFRIYFKQTIVKEQRNILSILEANIVDPRTPFTVVKLRIKDSIILEFYKKTDQSPIPSLVNQLVLPEKIDAYMNVRGTIKNLYSMDLNNDQIKEVLVPTYDENLIPRLHVIRYDSKAGLFIEDKALNYISLDP